MKVWQLMALCSLLACKAVKTSMKDREKMTRTAELNTIAVKGATREWDVLTYWGDGTVYRLEQMREQMDDAELARMEVVEERLLKKDEVLKEREPMKYWLYAGIGLVLLFALWLYKLCRI